MSASPQVVEGGRRNLGRREGCKQASLASDLALNVSRAAEEQGGKQETRAEPRDNSPERWRPQASGAPFPEAVLDVQ